MKTGIAIVGAGRWGVQLLRNFLDHPQSQILAVIDPYPERLVTVKERFNLDASTLLATSWSSVQGLPGLEAVAIATPASTHYSLISAALRQGYHVLAEKPLTLNLSEAIEVCQLAEQQKRQLFVDHTYLFHPAVERGKAVLQQGQLGELRYGYAQRTHLEPVRQDVSALWDLAIHDIGIFNTWLEQTPIQVQAIGTVLLGQTEAFSPVQNTDRPFPPQRDRSPLYDLVWIVLTYPSGFQAFIHVCWLNPDKQRRLGIVGSLGTLVFDETLAGSPLTLHHGRLEPANRRAVGSEPWKPVDLIREVLAVEPIEPLQIVCDRFLTCVQQNLPSSISSGWKGVELIRILAALHQSMELRGKPINLEACNGP